MDKDKYRIVKYYLYNYNRLDELKENIVHAYIEQFDNEFGSFLKYNIMNAPLLINMFPEYITELQNE